MIARDMIDSPLDWFNLRGLTGVEQNVRHSRERRSDVKAENQFLVGPFVRLGLRHDGR